mmetsp:Transcript_5796/g.11600  ORF Transcript_5796/g.11600 Transcript_5796/m.11600 type:complete len:226 (-) Transcript_5796:328-1005(-)
MRSRRLPTPTSFNLSRSRLKHSSEGWAKSGKHITCKGREGGGFARIAAERRGSGNLSPCSASSGSNDGFQFCSLPAWNVSMKLRKRSRRSSRRRGGLCPWSCQMTSRKSGSQCKTMSSKSLVVYWSPSLSKICNDGTLKTFRGRHSGWIQGLGQWWDMQSTNLNCSCRSGWPSSANLANWHTSAPPSEKPQSPSQGPLVLMYSIISSQDFFKSIQSSIGERCGDL